MTEVQRHPGPWTGPDAELARACAIAAIKDYGDDDPETYQRIMTNGVWNDHVAVQAALAAIYNLNIGRAGESGRAVIRNGQLIIALDIAALPVVVKGAADTNNWDGKYEVTDVEAFAKELVYQLNSEDERGTTTIHRMFDRSILHAVEYGAEGIDYSADKATSE